MTPVTFPFVMFKYNSSVGAWFSVLGRRTRLGFEPPALRTGSDLDGVEAFGWCRSRLDIRDCHPCREFSRVVDRTKTFVSCLRSTRTRCVQRRSTLPVCSFVSGSDAHLSYLGIWGREASTPPWKFVVWLMIFGSFSHAGRKPCLVLWLRAGTLDMVGPHGISIAHPVWTRKLAFPLASGIKCSAIKLPVWLFHTWAPTGIYIRRESPSPPGRPSSLHTSIWRS